MATLGTNAATLADWAQRVDNNHKVTSIVELLSQTNEILLDMLFLEGNLPTGHKTTVRRGLPRATWRLLNYGVPKGKSTTAQVTDTTGNLEAYAEIDKDLADLNNNTAAYRLSEAMAFIEGMNQQVAETVVYGNVGVTPERFHGIAPRYNTVTAATAPVAQNVIDAGGTGATNSSIYVVTWGERTTHGIFPKGKMTGLQHRDMGEHTVLDENGNQFQAYREHFKWELGMTVRDWRYNVRIANIDVTLLNGVSAANLINLLIRGLRRMPTTSPAQSNVQTSDSPNGPSGMAGRTVMYMNRTLATYMDLQAMNKANVNLTLENFGGNVVTMFRRIPIRICDAILNTEARVV